MAGSNVIEEYSVLLLEESRTHRELFAKWLPNYFTRIAATPDEVLAKFDSTVVAACLSRSALDDNEEEIRTHVLGRNPYCQLVMFSPRSAASPSHEEHYDECLRRPIFEADLRATVERRLKYGVYGALLHEFYCLSAELVPLERSDGPVESAAGMSADRLKSRLRHLKTRLNLLSREIDDDDVESIRRSLELHRKYLSEPARSAENAAHSKYRPDACPDCELPWGVDHGTELENGFVPVGAYVWKCTRCNGISHTPPSDNRRVAKR